MVNNFPMTCFSQDIAKLSKFVQISVQTSSDFLSQWILWKLQTSFQIIFFLVCFDKVFSFAILHKLTKFHYQIVFTFITRLCLSYSVNVFGVLCLGIWWRNDIRISEKSTFDYLKNERRFRSEIENNCPCF